MTAANTTPIIKQIEIITCPRCGLRFRKINWEDEQ